MATLVNRPKAHTNLFQPKTLFRVAPDQHNISAQLKRRLVLVPAWIYALALSLMICGTTSTAWAALQIGDRGSEVEIIQGRLRQLGYITPFTGNFDQATAEAVKQFQRDNDLNPDGVVGVQTELALFGSELRIVREADGTPRQALPPYLDLDDSTSRGETEEIPPLSEPANRNQARPELRRGVTNRSVELLQRSLRAAGFYVGPIDGIFEETTELAVRRFQAAYGLEVDGVVGAETWAELPNPPLPNYRYVVVIPSRGFYTLQAVRQHVPKAYLAESRLGRYVNAGAFPNRSNAEDLSDELRAYDLDARVVYFRW